MKTSEQSNVVSLPNECSLKPSQFVEPQPHYTIEYILGPGVTCIGSQESIYRYRLQEQMAEAIATGQPFLGGFITYRRRVMIIKEHLADYEETLEKVEMVQGVAVENNEGCGRSGLMGLIEKHSRKTKIFFVPDFVDILIPYTDYWEARFSIKKVNNGESKEVDNAPRPRNADYLRYKDSMQDLRSLAHTHGVRIITGHDLTTKNEFRDPRPEAADNKMYLNCSKGNGWCLETKGSKHIPTKQYKLLYDDYNGFSLAPGEVEKMTALSLSPKDKLVLEALSSGPGPMRAVDIKSKTGISQSTLMQRLKELRIKKWIVRNADKTYTLVRELPWLE